MVGISQGLRAIPFVEPKVAEFNGSTSIFINLCRGNPVTPGGGRGFEPQFLWKPSGEGAG